MIPVQLIVDQMQAVLDAENSQRYLFNEDFLPAIAWSVNSVTTAINSALSSKKLAPESLRDLIYVGVWQASSYSRIAFDTTAVGRQLWTIISVKPFPQTEPPTALSPPVPPEASTYLPSYRFLSAIDSAGRLTAEEWDINKKNIFERGNTVPTKSFTEYAYRDFAIYTPATVVGGSEIEIRGPKSVAGKAVALEYLVYPIAVTQITDEVEYPMSLLNLIVMKSLEFISFKQGDGTTLAQITERESDEIIKLINN